MPLLCPEIWSGVTLSRVSPVVEAACSCVASISIWPGGGSSGPSFRKNNAAKIIRQITASIHTGGETSGVSAGHWRAGDLASSSSILSFTVSTSHGTALPEEGSYPSVKPMQSLIGNAVDGMNERQAQGCGIRTNHGFRCWKMAASSRRFPSIRTPQANSPCIPDNAARPILAHHPAVGGSAPAAPRHNPTQGALPHGHTS